MKDMNEVYLHRDNQFFYRSIHPRGSNTPSPDDVLVFFSEFTRNIQFTDNSMYIETWYKHYGADGTVIYERSAGLHDADGLITPYDSDFSH
jgi:hypothetical protein